MQEMSSNRVITISRHRYILMSVAGLIMVGAIVYGFNTGIRMNAEYPPWINATMEIQLKATVAHLWFEEIISGDRHEKIDIVWEHLDQADWYARAMLEGGENPEGTFRRLDDAEMRGMIINIRERLAEFRVVTTQRIKAINISGPGSEIDQRYDSIFNEFITEAEEAETMLQKKMKRDLKYFRFAFVSMIILSSSIFLTVIIIFRRFDKQQLKNLRSLNKATMALETENKESRKTAETLRESEERYHSLISNISNVTWITNDSGETTFISPNIEKVYGYTAEEIYAAGDSLWLGRIHPEDIEKVKNAYDNLFKKEGHFNIQYRIQRKDGEWIWLHDNAMTTYEKEGLRFAYGVFSDITERKNVENALKESTERFRGLVESTSDWIWEIDENAVYTYVSPKTYDILGYTPEEVLGRRPFDFMTPEEVKRVSDFFSSIIDARKPFNNLQNINIHKNGNLVFLETSGVPIFNHKGEFCGYRGIDRDITDRKQDEEELEKHRKHLEEMVRDRTKELEEKTKDLEDYNKLFAEREFRIKELKDRIKKLEREKSNK